MDLITSLGVFVKGAHQMPGLISGMGIGFKIVMLVFGIFWIVMLINCLQRDFKVPTDKIAWILVLVFLPVLGAFIYLFSLYFGVKGKKARKKNKR